MKLSSQSIAKLVILLSLVIATTSGLYAHRTTKSISTAKANLAKLEQDEKSLRQSSGEMLKLLTKTSEPPSLNTVVASLLVTVMRQRLENGVSISTVNPATSIASNGTAPVKSLAKAFESSDVLSTRVNVRGTYDNYEGLLSYIEQVRKQSVAVVYLKIDGQQFELGLRAYGV
jgi:hypothetical protein